MNKQRSNHLHFFLLYCFLGVIVLSSILTGISQIVTDPVWREGLFSTGILWFVFAMLLLGVSMLVDDGSSVCPDGL